MIDAVLQQLSQIDVAEPNRYLLVSALLFALGLFGVVTRRNAIGILMGIELMLNAANINFVAFSRSVGSLDGQVFALIVITLAAAEAAVGLAIILRLYRNLHTVNADEVAAMKW
jgi:NADH-quinone oxidoreductase subunit K